MGPSLYFILFALAFKRHREQSSCALRQLTIVDNLAQKHFIGPTKDPRAPEAKISVKLKYLSEQKSKICNSYCIEAEGVDYCIVNFMGPTKDPRPPEAKVSVKLKYLCEEKAKICRLY